MMRWTAPTRAAERISGSVSAPPTFSQPCVKPARRLVTADRAIAFAIVAATLLGAGLRLWRAQSPLWLDEIWSLDNLAGLSHSWEVFWRISHDNNHFLNSLWLFWVADADDPLVLRAPSVLMGAALVALMARLAWRREAKEAALIAALLAAFSYFFIAYSAEARGYAGEALALAAAFLFVERGMAEATSASRFGLAAAAGVGMFWHLGTLPAVAALALACLLEWRRRDGRWDVAVAKTVHLFAPAALAVMPALACIGAGVLVTGRLTVGGIRAFAYEPTYAAMAAAIREAIGAPATAPTFVILGGAAAGVTLGLRLVKEDRRIVYAIFLLGAPLAVLILRPANAHIVRYYLPSLLFFILFAAEMLGSLWRQGGLRRSAAILALAGMLMGDVAALVARQVAGSPAWPEALATIEASNALVVASSADMRIGRYIDVFNRRHATPIELAPRSDWCAKRPDWLIAEPAAVEGKSERIEVGPCRLPFEFIRAYDAGGPETFPWRLYRRLPSSGVVP
jgi:hypothetical protein